MRQVRTLLLDKMVCMWGFRNGSIGRNLLNLVSGTLFIRQAAQWIGNGGLFIFISVLHQIV